MDAGILFLFSILLRLGTQALPVKEKEKPNCINMTPERAAEISKIGEEVNKFINDLSDKHEDFDFTFVELKVEKHSDDDDVKEIILKISVIDCNNESYHPKKEDRFFENDDHNCDDVKSENDDSSPTYKNSVAENKEKPESESKYGDKDETKQNEDSTDGESGDNESAKRNKQVNPIKSLSKASKHNEIENIGDNDDGKENQKSSRNTKDNSSQRNFNDKKANLQIVESIADIINGFDEIENKNFDSNLNPHYNNNGNHDNSNFFIYAPNIDNSNSKVAMDTDSFYYNLLSILFQKFMNKKSANAYKSNANYVSSLLKTYDLPVGDNFEYFNSQPYEHEIFYADGSFRNLMMNKLKNADKNSNDGIYGLENNYDFLNESEDYSDHNDFVKHSAKWW